MQYNSGAYGRGNPRLPAGWRQLYDTNSNRNYYVNDVTGTTQWEPPQAAPVAPQPLPGCQVVQVNLPPGVPPGGLIQIQVSGSTICETPGFVFLFLFLFLFLGGGSVGLLSRCPTRLRAPFHAVSWNRATFRASPWLRVP